MTPNVDTPSPPSPGHIALSACVAEVLAPKAGNVHPGADFEDTIWVEFVLSASVCGPLLNNAAQHGVGRTILSCVQATRRAVGTNTNLGMILLMAPLCAVGKGERLSDGVCQVLGALGPLDAQATYEAIRLASPGGLGRVENDDVSGSPPDSLVAAMRLAAPRDAVARQYATNFNDVLEIIAPELSAHNEPLDQAIVRVHLEQMAREPDSLIVRKCGQPEGLESQRRAADVLDAGWPSEPRSLARFAELDAWCRAKGHRRNPGTSADLVAAALFAALRDGAVAYPLNWSAQLNTLTHNL